MEVKKEGEGLILKLTTQGSRNSLWHVCRRVDYSSARTHTYSLSLTHSHRFNRGLSGRSKPSRSGGNMSCIYMYPIHCTQISRLLEGPALKFAHV